MFGRTTFDEARVGNRVPPVSLCELAHEELHLVRADTLFRGVRAVVLGVPGAFTPVCTQRHIPEFVRNADAMRAAGYSLLVCIAPNSPWAVDHWARELDPENKIRFLADGNLDFVRAFNLMTRAEDLFLGDCSKRYLMTLDNAIVERIKVEARVTDITCTSTDTLLVD